MIERISKRLDGWKKAHLSLGGRITLLHSCLSHILSYFLSLFKIPTSVVAKVERMQMNFLWSGVGEGKRDHLVSWDAVKFSKTGQSSPRLSGERKEKMKLGINKPKKFNWKSIGFD